MATFAAALGCQATPLACPPHRAQSADSAAAAATSGAHHQRETIRALGELLDQWHAAAARADEEAYFAALSEDAIFLGTDASERWDKRAFRDFAHPFFKRGKAWIFRAARRAITLSRDGRSAWFDEDLETPNLGPARGSGVLVERDGSWRIAHYNLTITIPNDRFDEVKALLESPADDDAPPK